MRRGFTLAEALVACGLLLSILTAMAVLVRSFSASGRASDVHASSLSGARLAMESVRRDAESATKLLEPVLGSVNPEPTLRLQRIDPEVARLPEDYPSSPPAFWDPYEPTQVVEVRYSMLGQTLIREVGFQDGTLRKTRVAENLGGFSVSSLPDETLQVRCTVLSLQGDPKPTAMLVTLRCLDRRP